MKRLVLAIVGVFTLTGALAILWQASLAGRTVLGGFGVVARAFEPRDVALVYTLMFGVGFAFVTGVMLDRASSRLVHAVAGGRMEGRESLLPPLLWGAFAYVAIAALLGCYVIFFSSPPGTSLSSLLESPFLRFVMYWPYHVAAIARPFGLPVDGFY